MKAISRNREETVGHPVSSSSRERLSNITNYRHSRRWRAVGMLGVLAVCMAGMFEVRVTSPAESAVTSQASAPPSQRPIANAQAFTGQGRLAIVWSDGLYVLDGRAGGFRHLSSPALAATPAWSADGRWLAYLRLSSLGTAVGELWIIDLDSGQSRRVGKASQNVSRGGFAWSPVASVLAVLIPDATGASQLWLAHPGKDPQRVPNVDDAISSFDWSPDGKMLAYVTTKRTPTPRDLVKTITITAGPSVSRFEAPPFTGVELAGWWPNGKGLLFWPLREYSRSLAADGLLLYSLPLRGDKPWPLVAMLPYRDWLSWAPDGRRLVMVEGFGREVWKEKSLTVCDAEAGACRHLLQQSDAVSLDPSWSPAGNLIAFVRARTATWAGRWMDTRALRLAAPDGTQAREVVRAGRGIVGPMWSTTGGDLLFWRDESIWLLNRKTDVVMKIVGPFPAKLTPSNFYGHVSWRDLISWHRP